MLKQGISWWLMSQRTRNSFGEHYPNGISFDLIHCKADRNLGSTLVEELDSLGAGVGVGGQAFQLGALKKAVQVKMTNTSWTVVV